MLVHYASSESDDPAPAIECNATKEKTGPEARVEGAVPCLPLAWTGGNRWSIWMNERPFAEGMLPVFYGFKNGVCLPFGGYPYYLISIQ